MPDVSTLAFQELYVKINYVIQFNWKKTKQPKPKSKHRATKGHSQQVNKIFLGEVNTECKTKPPPQRGPRNSYLSGRRQQHLSPLGAIRKSGLPWSLPGGSRAGTCKAWQTRTQEIILYTTHSQPSKTSHPFSIGNQKYDTHFSNFFFPITKFSTSEKHPG